MSCLSLDSRKVLVLNKSWSPISTITLRDAIVMLFNNGEPKAKIIDPESYQQMTWKDWAKLKPENSDKVIRSSTGIFKVPEIILLTKYDQLPSQKIHFSRRMLFKRDMNICQYCAKKPKFDELTIDHIVPRSRGGKTTWNNCVLACFKCNAKKANKTPEEAGMKLLNTPKKPDLRLVNYDFRYKVESWEAFLGEMYWTVELENDEL